MKMKEKMWAVLVHLGTDLWQTKYRYDHLFFDDELWESVLEQCKDAGVNTIVLDVANGIEYGSHPEIATKGAWSRKRVRSEIKRCKELGIALIPKLNFATPHCIWLGEYSKMISTKEYYHVVNDLIKEVYELFEHPKYIHLGMDEEDAKHVASHELAIFRQGSLYWHDLRYMIDCVQDTGAIPWIWSCALFDHPEEYKEHIGADEVVLSPWYYNAFRKEHWTPIESRAEYVAYYNEGDYASMGIKYVEEDPFLVNFRKVALPLMKEGYSYIPCASVYNRCDYNTSDLVEYFKDNAPDEQIVGYITAPWCHQTTWEMKQFLDESFKFLKEAKEKFYK